MDTLDNILSGQGDAVSEQVNEDVTQQAEPAEEIQQEQPKTEADEDQAVDVGGQKMVPHAALHASKEKVKRYTEEVVDLRKSNEALQRQITEVLQRIPVPKKEAPQEQPKPDWFENPEGATQHAVQQSVDPHFQRINQTLLANAQLVAGMKYGDDKVEAADKAFMDAVQSGKIDPADYQRVTTSPNIFAAAVQWHQRQQALTEIGDDPAAYRAKVEAELLAKHGLTQNDNGQQQQASPAQAMPSNIAGARNVGSRTGPAWSGPPSLQDIFAR